MKTLPLSLLICIFLYFPQLSEASLLRETSLPMQAEEWTPSLGLHVTATPTGGLQLKGDLASASIRLRKSLALASNSVIIIEAPGNRGELIIQAEWLGAGGAFLGSKDLARLNGPVVSKEIPLSTPPDKTTSFGLKLWFAADAINSTVNSITLRQQVDWPAHLGTTTVGTYLPTTSTVADSKISMVASPRLLTLKLKESGSASVHLDQPMPYIPAGQVLLAVESISPGTGLSIQAVFFDAKGTYLGDRALLSDLTRSGDYVTRFGYLAEPVPNLAARVTFKLWLSGSTSASASVNGLLYGQPAK